MRALLRDFFFGEPAARPAQTGTRSAADSLTGELNPAARLIPSNRHKRAWVSMIPGGSK